MKRNLSDLKQMFTEQVDKSHIKYAWDGGHCYSYIEHSLMSYEFEIQEECDEWTDFTNEWLYENDECPPCQFVLENGVMRSSCGCHDGIEDKQEIEGIIKVLMTHPDNK